MHEQENTCGGIIEWPTLAEDFHGNKKENTTIISIFTKIDTEGVWVGIFFVEWKHGYFIIKLRRGGPNKTIPWIWAEDVHINVLRGL